MVKYTKKNNAGLKCFTVPTGKVVCAKKSKFKPYDINKDKRLTTKAKKKMMATRIQQRVRKQKELKKPTAKGVMTIEKKIKGKKLKNKSTIKPLLTKSKPKPKRIKAGSKIVKKLKSKLKVIKAKKVLKKKKLNKAIKGAVNKAVVRDRSMFDEGSAVQRGSVKNSKMFKLKFIKKNKQIFKKIKMVSGKHVKNKNLYRHLLSGKFVLGRYSLKELEDIVKNKDVMIAKGTKKKDRLRKKKEILEKYKLALKDKPKKVSQVGSSVGFDKDSDARKLTDNMYDFYENYMRGLRTESITPEEFEEKIIKEVGKRRLKKFSL